MQTCSLTGVLSALYPDRVHLPDIPSAITDQELKALIASSAGRRVLEIGAYKGRSTVGMAKMARIVHTVDWHQGDRWIGEHQRSLEDFTTNIDRYGVRDKVVLHLGRTEDVLPFLRPGSFEMVFHDADHSYEGLRREIHSSLELLTYPATVAIHDYDHENHKLFSGVRGASEEILGEPRWVVDTLAIFRLSSNPS